MSADKNLTLPKQALTIMGRANFISVEDVLEIFPWKKKDLGDNYDLIPYSQELLYNLSSEENPFILFPAFNKIGNVSLTINTLKDFTSAGKYDFFQPMAREILTQRPSFVYRATCAPRWYLLSKEVMTRQVFNLFCAEADYDPDQFRPTSAVVYVYCWIIFKILRRKTLFLENRVHTIDSYSDRLHAGMAYLLFNSGKIAVADWVNPADDIRHTSIVPSVAPHTK